MRGDLAARRTRLRGVIEPVVTAAGYDLEELTVSRAGRRHVVRVIVDGDAGVHLDAVADISRAVSRALDEAEESGGDLVAGEYQLEISSPGVDRPLVEARHWRRNVGRLVKVTAKTPGVPVTGRPAEGGTGATGPTGQLTGRVVNADDEWLTLELESGPVRWRYPELGPGRVQVEFSRPGVDDDLDSGLVDDDDDLADGGELSADDDDHDDDGFAGDGFDGDPHDEVEGGDR